MRTWATTPLRWQSASTEPGREPHEVKKHDSEAVHILEGQGIYEAWPENVPDDSPITAPLQPGMEIITGQFVRHRITVTGDTPMVAIVTECHVDFPAYPHNYPAIFQPGRGTDIHQHDNRVEAFYVIKGPGAVVIADPDNTTTRELMVPERGAAYQPMYVYHRQFNPEPDGAAMLLDSQHGRLHPQGQPDAPGAHPPARAGRNDADVGGRLRPVDQALEANPCLLPTSSPACRGAT